MSTNFVLSKTFEPKQKRERSSLDIFVAHPNFWWELPFQYTKQIHVAGIIRSGGVAKLQVPWYTDFFIKAVEYGNSKNGTWLLCGILANTRQGQWTCGAYLVEPDEIQAGKITLLRNSDRHPIRNFVVHYGPDTKTEPSKNTRNLSSYLTQEIPSLAILDKKIF